MRRIILATVAAISLTAAGALYADRAEAAPLFDGLQGAVPASNFENVQLLFLFGGHRYCWYPDGWNGPGWYWCGYRLRRGLGYGGGEGWQGHGAPRGDHDHGAPRGDHGARAPSGGLGGRTPNVIHGARAPKGGGGAPKGGGGAPKGGGGAPKGGAGSPKGGGDHAKPH